MSLPNKMNYIKIEKNENLILKRKKIPEINEYEVLVKVFASGVNRPDVLQRKGLYNPPESASDILGLEISGKIVKKGRKVKLFKLNDNVCALTHGGGYAEYCKVYWEHVMPNPKGYTHVESAAIPETFCTVWYNLFDLGKLKKNETLLVHGGSSGIGTTAIQLAKLIGCTVITTVGSPKKVKACKDLGADLVINYKNNDFFKEVIIFTGKKSIDVVLDMIGKKYFSKNISLLKDRGRLLVIAFLTGNITKLDLKSILLNRLVLTGSTLRPRTNLEKSRIIKNVYKRYWTVLSKKTIKPIIYKTFALKDAKKAHDLMESSRHVGKIILIQ